jgi:DNA-binding HxlR family transcriptional regulator
LVQREAIAEIPPRVQYYLTKGGKQLRKSDTSLVAMDANYYLRECYVKVKGASG